MKNKFIVIIIACIIIIGLIWLIWQRNLESQTSARPLPTVTIETVQLQPITTEIEAIGTTSADKSVTITANVTEYIKKIMFKDGDYVEKGDLLIQLEDNEEVAELEAAYAKLKVAQQFYNRTLKLSKQEYLSAQEHDTSIADMNSAKSVVNVIKARIQDRKIYAPFSGYLGLKVVSEGALIEPNEAIVTLDKIDILDVDFDIPEFLLSQVAIGQSVTLTSIAYPDEKFQGKVSNIETRVNPNTRAFTVRVSIDNKDKKLKPGMLMKVQLATKTRESILIPESAVLNNRQQHFVFVLNNNDTVTQQKIQIGQRQQGKVEVLSGLSAGTKLVVDGGFKLNNGQTVKVVSNKKESKT